MKFVRNVTCITMSVLCSLAVHSAQAADQPAWQDRCKLGMKTGDFGEEGQYLFQTRGAEARGRLNFNVGAAASLIEYPTEAKGLMSNYTGPKMFIGIFGDVGASPPQAGDFTMGWFGLSATARNFDQIPGNITALIEIDGKSFGPYSPDASRAADGVYSLWIDTAATDADFKPPIVDAAGFKAIADAVSTMEKGAYVLLRDGNPIVRMPLPKPRYQNWQIGLAGWSESARDYINKRGSCPAGSEKVE